MGNCLHKKFLGSVDNDNLPKLSVYTVEVKTEPSVDATSARVGFNCLSPITIKPIGGHYWTERNNYGNVNVWRDEELTIYPKSYTPGDVEQALTEIFLENKDFKLEVSSKYEISTIVITTGSSSAKAIAQVGNFADLKYFPLQCLYLGYCNNAVGNVKDIPMGSLKELNLVGQSNVTGNIADINSTELKVLGLYKSGVTGSIDDFVSAQCNAGRTSVAYNSPITVRAILDKRSFAGFFYNLGNIVEEMYWDGNDKVAVYHGGTYSANTYTHVYVKGFSASDSEVVAWKAAGKTVIDAATNTEL